MDKPRVCPECGGTPPPEGCPVCDAPVRPIPKPAIRGVGLDVASSLMLSLDTLAPAPMRLHYPLPEGIRISQRFGENPSWYPVSQGHNGVDWACIVGTPVYAMANGTVSVARNDGKSGYGRHVRIQHANGISIYGHLSVIQCSVGDTISIGEQIGLSGGASDDPGSGFSTGPHLHAEYRLTGVPNPVPGGYVYNAIDILPLLVSELMSEWEVQGVDVSAWNGNMDFSITKTKVQYVVVRLGYGDGWKDSRCDKYRQDLIANDIPYFGYWYVKAGQSVDAHANGFAQVYSEYPGGIGLEEDFEYTTLDKVGTLNWITAFHNKLRSLVGQKCTPYSNWNFWANKVAPNTLFLDEQWVAHWTQNPTPLMPPGWQWKKGTKWQWSADGNGLARSYGMISDGDVDMDLDRYYGTCADFNARYGTHIVPIGEPPPPPPPPPPPGTDFLMECLVDGLRVRICPSTDPSCTVVGSLNTGDRVALANVGGSMAFMQIKSGPFAGKWCAVETIARYMKPVG